MGFNLEFKATDSNREIRQIAKIILHCSDSDNIEHDNIEVIRQWHKSRGFNDVGYHFFIRSSGQIEIGRPIYKIGAHCLSHNFNSIGVCLSGKTNFSNDQFHATYILIRDLLARFKLSRYAVFPHNYFDKKKTCPNFEIDELWQFDTHQQTC